MKLKLSILALAGCALVGQASAQTGCNTGTRLGNTSALPALTNTLSNNTVCAVRGSDRWQEFHASSGRVFDYKRGPNHPIDPTEDVGSWQITGTGTSTVVTYNYGSGGTYTYSVWRQGTSPNFTYNFCGMSGTSFNGNNVIRAITRSGQVACP